MCAVSPTPDVHGLCDWRSMHTAAANQNTRQFESKVEFSFGFSCSYWLQQRCFFPIFSKVKLSRNVAQVLHDLLSKRGCIEATRLCFLTMALHGVGLVLWGSLHYLLHHIPFPMGCCQGCHEEQDARYSYVHLERSNLQR